MNNWDGYQKFSTEAKAFGGAEEYLDSLTNKAHEEGRDEGTIQGIVGTCLVGLVGWGIHELYKWLVKQNSPIPDAPVMRREFLNNVKQCETCNYGLDDGDEDDDDEYGEQISVEDAADIWLCHGKDEDYTFGYSEEELEDAL